MTIKQRRERPLYGLALVSDRGVHLDRREPRAAHARTHHIPGINNAAWHGLFIHYVVGLWITPAATC